LIVANIEAYKARRIDTEYGESFYIGLIMLCLLQILLVGVPMFYILHENPVARFFLTSSMVFIMSMAVLFLIFLPKYLIYRQRLRDASDGRKKSNVVINGFNHGQKTTKPNPIEEAEKAVESRLLYNETWKKRIILLAHLLEKEGIDFNSYLRKANITDNQNEILPVEINYAPPTFSNLRQNARSAAINALGRISTIDSILNPDLTLMKQRDEKNSRDIADDDLVIESRLQTTQMVLTDEDDPEDLEKNIAVE